MEVFQRRGKDCITDNTNQKLAFLTGKDNNSLLAVEEINKNIQHTKYHCKYCTLYIYLPRETY